MYFLTRALYLLLPSPRAAGKLPVGQYGDSAHLWNVHSVLGPDTGASGGSQTPMPAHKEESQVGLR
jgi:hypothetical protein